MSEHADVDGLGFDEEFEDDVNESADLDEGEDDTGESYLDEEAGGLWDGDRGNLDGKQRDTLVALLKKAFISSDDRAEWRTLTRDPGPIATNLNNLYFNLVIDERSEVAYASPARTLDNPFRTLVRDAPNSREETLLLIYLRERFRSATASGETHVFTDEIAMFEYVERFRPESATDRVGDEKRVTNAINGLVTAGLLVKTDDVGRFRVHRAIEALLPLARLSQLLEAFERTRCSAADEAGAHSYGGKHAAPDSAVGFVADDEAAEAERLGDEESGERLA